MDSFDKIYYFLQNMPEIPEDEEQKVTFLTVLMKETKEGYHTVCPQSGTSHNLLIALSNFIVQFTDQLADEMDRDVNIVTEELFESLIAHTKKFAGSKALKLENYNKGLGIVSTND